MKSTRAICKGTESTHKVFTRSDIAFVTQPFSISVNALKLVILKFNIKSYFYNYIHNCNHFQNQFYVT
jgi:hypothetical protein